MLTLIPDSNNIKTRHLRAENATNGDLKMITITFDASESLAQELEYFAQTKQKSLNETLNEIVQAYFSKLVNVADINSNSPQIHRKRYALNELLEGTSPEFISELNQETEWAREGDAVGRELT
jgi:predicted PolB exonuclease-like 3'-5' exonuclease